jgi:hypothetical protein
VFEAPSHSWLLALRLSSYISLEGWYRCASTGEL